MRGRHENDDANYGPSPGADRKCRLECLKIALGCINPGNGSSPQSVIKDAAVFYRYVIEGVPPSEAKLVEMKHA